ncbi:MAG: hypothetical protein K6D94_12085 [Clostridiales bacterium]|nr:hypothetical protein [Clostridiales bacterium]
MKRIICCVLSLLTAASLMSCAAISELEDRLDSLTGSAAGFETASPEPVSATEEAETQPPALPETTEAPPPAVETEPPAQTDSGLPKISEFAPPYLFAVTFTYYARDEMPAITDPEILWEALAWYCAYKNYFSGSETVSDEELAAAMKVMTGSDEYTEIPDEFSSGETIIHEDGQYSFPDFSDAMPYYFGDEGTMDFFYVATDDSLLCNGIIREMYEGSTYEFDVAYTFAEKDGSYVIEHFVFGDDYVKPEPKGEPVSYDRLREIGEANDLTSLLGEGDAMKELRSYVGDITDVEYVFYKNNHVAVLSTNQSNEGPVYYRGVYGALEFNEDDSGKVLCSPAGGDIQMWDINYGNTVNGLLESWMEQQFDVYLYYDDGALEGIMAETSSDVSGSTTTMTIVYDKETLVAKSWSTMSFYHTEEGDETYGSTTSFEKIDISEIDNPLVARIDEYDGELKKVTMVMLGEYGYTNEYVMPVGWKFSTYVEDKYIYADEECTKPFKYPEDGSDYTMYINLAEG